MHGARDRQILRKPPGSIQQICPVVLASAHERQFLCARIGHINGDIPAVLRDPPEADRPAISIAAPEEMRDESTRQDELEQRAAEEPHHLTEWRENQMSCLVDRQVYAIEERS